MASWAAWQDSNFFIKYSPILGRSPASIINVVDVADSLFSICLYVFRPMAELAEYIVIIVDNRPPPLHIYVYNAKRMMRSCVENGGPPFRSQWYPFSAIEAHCKPRQGCTINGTLPPQNS